LGDQWQHAAARGEQAESDTDKCGRDQVHAVLREGNAIRKDGEGSREQRKRQKHRGRQRQADIEQEDRPDAREGSMKVREARGEDKGKGECVNDPVSRRRVR
jgi:hypothetical protein